MPYKETIRYCNGCSENTEQITMPEGDYTECKTCFTLALMKLGYRTREDNKTVYNIENEIDYPAEMTPYQKEGPQ